MATKRPASTRVETIHCEFCGEDYAATYKRCPFCDGRASESEEESAPRGGRRAYSNTRGGGYGGGPPISRVIGTVISLAIIIAAAIIVISFIKPLMDKGKTPPVDPNVPGLGVITSTTPKPEDSPDPNVTADPNAIADPNTTLGTSMVPDPSAPPTTPPASQTAKSIETLSTTDVSLEYYGEFFDLKAVLAPVGSVGTVSFSSADPTVAKVELVNGNGRVTALSRGNTTITVTLPGAPPLTCIVRCKFDAPASVTPSTPPTGTGTPSTDPGNLKLNSVDFTMQKAGEVVKMKVSGAAGTPVWSIDKPSVATISSDGSVTAVAHGNATVTCTVDGKVLTCIVRCGF